MDAQTQDQKTIPLKDRKYIINMDKVKEGYSKLYPERKPLTNGAIAKLTGKTAQLFTDYQNPNKKKPDTPLVLQTLCELSGLQLKDLIDYVEPTEGTE